MRIHPAWAIVIGALAVIGLLAVCNNTRVDVDDEVGIELVAR